MSQRPVTGESRVRVHEKALEFADNTLPNSIRRLDNGNIRITVFDNEDLAVSNVLLHVDVGRLQLLDLLFP